jgi:hypothetical protein
VASPPCTHGVSWLSASLTRKQVRLSSDMSPAASVSSAGRKELIAEANLDRAARKRQFRLSWNRTLHGPRCELLRLIQTERTMQHETR